MAKTKTIVLSERGLTVAEQNALNALRAGLAALRVSKPKDTGDAEKHQNAKRLCLRSIRELEGCQ